MTHSKNITVIQGELPWTNRKTWLYPIEDKGTICWPFGYKKKLDVDIAIDSSIPYLTGFDTCIQAGGCIGVWPVRLAQFFKNVHTFEPERTNFECLIGNVSGIDNIVCHNKALGDKPGFVDMHLIKEGHCGAFFTKPGKDIPVVMIDSLNLDVDFIWLDLEGGETSALVGAKETIERCRPVIGFEMREFTKRYGGIKPIDYLKKIFNYKSKGMLYHYDYLLIP